MSSPKLLSPITPTMVALAFGQVVTAVSAVLVQPHGLVQGGAPLAGLGVPAGGVAVGLTLTGGADGERYDIAVTATHAGGAASEITLQAICIDPEWTMDDGSPGMVDLHAFVDRFGVENTIAATSDGGGVINRRSLIAALRDAQARAFAELARRYTLPPAFMPAVVTAAIYDIAAERMYAREVPDHVALAARVARGDLQRMGSGDLPLPGLAGVIAPGGGSEGGFAIHPGDTSFVGGLGDYVRGHDHDRY